MRKINENDYDYFIIAASWGNVTLHSLKSALKEWNNTKNGTFYGIKPDGRRAILDTK